MKTLLWVAAGGACGAVLRYAVQALAASWSLPWGTFAVNAIGCFAIGAMLAAFAGAPWFETVGRAFLMVGLLGAFTTFSAFSADTLLLYEQDRFASALGYVVATVVVCIVAAFAGYRLFGAWR